MTHAQFLARALTLLALCCLGAVLGWPAEGRVSLGDVVRSAGR